MTEMINNREENIEASGLEWGPSSEARVGYAHAEELINKTNASLAGDEKPWRLPSAEDLIKEFQKIDSTPDGFKGDAYWTSFSFPDHVYCIHMATSALKEISKNNGQAFLRLVR